MIGDTCRECIAFFDSSGRSRACGRENQLERRPDAHGEEVSGERASVAASQHDVCVHDWAILAAGDAEQRGDLHLFTHRDARIVSAPTPSNRGVAS